MGHLMTECHWENDLKPQDYERYEADARRIMLQYRDHYIKDVYKYHKDSDITTAHWQVINNNPILRFYLNDTVFVRVDYSSNACSDGLI